MSVAWEYCGGFCIKDIEHHPFTDAQKAAVEKAIASETDPVLDKLEKVNGLLMDLVEGLDSNMDPERCGLSEEEWEDRVSAAKDYLAEEAVPTKEERDET